MKYGIVSDLHLDHYGSEDRPAILSLINRCGADHLLIAGDLGNSHTWEGFLKKLTIPYTWVRGNHDYYRETFGSHNGVDGAVTYATLWTRFWNKQMFEIIAESSVSDFYKITSLQFPGEAIRAPEMRAQFDEHLQFLKDNPNDIILTHFPPSLRSVAPQYDGDLTNAYFVNDLTDDEVQAFGAKLWVHGHVHGQFDYTIGSTRIICNPLGYPGENYQDPRDYRVVLVDI